MIDVLIWMGLISVGLVALGTAVFVSFLGMAVFGSPWVPTSRQTARSMLELAHVQPGESVLDIGCGDGTILQLAKSEFRAGKVIGYDIHPILLWRTKRALEKSKGNAKVVTRCGDIRRMNIEQADVVMLYLLPGLMKAIRPKLAKLAPNIRIVCNGIPFVDAQALAIRDDERGHIYLYHAGDL